MDFCSIKIVIIYYCCLHWRLYNKVYFMVKNDKVEIMSLTFFGRQYPFVYRLSFSLLRCFVCNTITKLQPLFSPFDLLHLSLSFTCAIWRQQLKVLMVQTLYSLLIQLCWVMCFFVILSSSWHWMHNCFVFLFQLCLYYLII